ncbi:MAG: response regulator transcription factor [Clostridia bacterium]|nr:response regulator transcription factor [Clostridia bacterium]
MEEIKVLIADDHALIREGLRKILSLELRFKVVAEACDGEEAIVLCRQHNPHVVLMDLNMPRMDGVEACRMICREMPQVRVVALTVHDDQERVLQGIKAGLSGYILKDISSEVLINTVIAVHAGETVMHPSVTARLIGEFNRLEEVAATIGERENLFELLTHREMDILKLIAAGKSNREIADALIISEKTVKNHISNLFKKIGVEDRTQAALYAVKTKLIDI